MEPIAREGLDKLYRTYGFEINKDHEDIGLYIYRKSRYFGVDIIPLNSSETCNAKALELKEKYANSGYAADVKKINTLDEAEIELYKSFFSFNSTLTRLKKKYQDFQSKQTRSLLGNPYEYVDTPFEQSEIDSTGQNKKLLKEIEALLLTDSPQLIIIEAAAGYGKTCAAYETLKVFTHGSHFKTPIFTELARNRGAKIFRYILLDEIDIEFPTLNSDLVVHEIKNGRVPLIIDGFDELLDKVNVEVYEDNLAFDEIETMLDTIGSLLKNKAKIVLTTRKTAIFSGIEFDKWLNKWDQGFNVARFSLKEPRIKDWLGSERLSKIKNNNIPIQYIANPVILTFLKNVHNEAFDKLLTNPENLIKQYFEKMLERERERQGLIITVDRQYEIFKNVVKLLLEFDITVESKEFFKEIIKDQNLRLLEYTRSLYPSHERPTIANLVDILATHALLDRKGRDESQIGFINDFVIGVFIGEIICESQSEKISDSYSVYMIELAATAYKVQSRKNKQILWSKIMTVNYKFSPLSIFNFDITLQENLMREYVNLSISDTTFFNIQFNAHSISSSVLIKCYFKNCRFDLKVFHSVGFVDCIFDSCELLNSNLIDNTSEITAINCTEINCHVLAEIQYANEPIEEDVEIKVLQNLWTISLTKAHHIMQLLQKFDKKDHKRIFRTLDTLVKKDTIKINGNHIYLNVNKISEIKKSLNQ